MSLPFSIRRRLFGVSIEISIPEELESRALSILPPVPPGLSMLGSFEEDERRGLVRRYLVQPHGTAWELTLGNYSGGRFEVHEDLFDTLRSDLRLWVAAMAYQVCFVHAGAVALNKEAIVFPGSSHSGKTTLIAALLERGAAYYSDDYAVLDHRGCLWPFALPLALRESDGRRRYAEPGGLTGSATPVSWVIKTRYEPGAVFRGSRLSPGQTVLALLEHAPGARLRPESTLEFLTQATRTAVGLQGNRGEASEFAEQLDLGHWKSEPGLEK
jgi:hypothetical protein